MLYYANETPLLQLCNIIFNNRLTSTCVVVYMFKPALLCEVCSSFDLIFLESVLKQICMWNVNRKPWSLSLDNA